MKTVTTNIALSINLLIILAAKVQHKLIPVNTLFRVFLKKKIA
jgi:hypothetical protein